MSQPRDPFTPSPEIAAVAVRWIRTYAARRSDAAVRLFSCSDAVSYIGSDEGEFFEGADMRRMFGAFTDHQVVLELEDMEARGFESGPVGWAYILFTVYSPKANMRVRFRSTMILSLEDAVWRVVHVHNSNPKPNMESMGYGSPDLDKLAAAAAPDEIRVTDATRAMIGGQADFAFTDAKSVPLKGLEGEHILYSLDWTS